MSRKHFWRRFAGLAVQLMDRDAPPRVEGVRVSIICPADRTEPMLGPNSATRSISDRRPGPSAAWRKSRPIEAGSRPGRCGIRQLAVLVQRRSKPARTVTGGGAVGTCEELYAPLREVPRQACGSHRSAKVLQRKLWRSWRALRISTRSGLRHAPAPACQGWSPPAPPEDARMFVSSRVPLAVRDRPDADRGAEIAVVGPDRASGRSRFAAGPCRPSAAPSRTSASSPSSISRSISTAPRRGRLRRDGRAAPPRSPASGVLTAAAQSVRPRGSMNPRRRGAQPSSHPIPTPSRIRSKISRLPLAEFCCCSPQYQSGEKPVRNRSSCLHDAPPLSLCSGYITERSP